MLIVHHLGRSQSERIVWLCEELGLDYDLKRYERLPDTQLAPPEYVRLHPLGTAPVIEDGALKLAESGAIVEHVLSQYGAGRLEVARAAANRPDYLFWFHFANGSFMPAIMFDTLIPMFAGAAAESDPVCVSLRNRARVCFGLVEQRLSETDYFAGPEFTAADIVMGFPLTTMSVLTQRDLGAYPSIQAYARRIAQRPAYRRAMEKADPGLARMGL